MSESPSRRCALDALAEWEDSSRFAESILADQAARHRLAPPDRGLAQELLYGVIRNLALLDETVALLRQGPVQHSTRRLLRLGLYQLLHTGIAEHAAVHETVALARPRERKLVNAVLRSAQRRRAEMAEALASLPLAARTSHPEFLVQRWREQHGEAAAAALCEWNNSPPPVYARLNPLAPDREALARAEEEARPLMLGGEHPGFFRVEGAPDRAWLEAGLIYVQDPSTALACRLLDPRPGETVLDACAAPGGKTALLASLTGGEEEGRLWAVDASARRLERLRRNLDRLGIRGVETRILDWTAPAPAADLPEQFDAILLDAPCSNTGVMRRRVDVRWRLDEREFARQARTQSALLAAAAERLRPGGRIVYSTCSLDREENESVAESSGLELVGAAASLPWRDGFDGAFAALLRK